MEKSIAYGWLKHYFDGLTLPTFENSESVYCFSDYSGDRKEDQHYTYSFLILPMEEMHKVVGNIMDLRYREKGWGEKSMIEYKRMKDDKIRRRLLPDFLKLFNNLNGILVTVSVEKKSPNFFFIQDEGITEKLQELGFGKWKPGIIRKISDILFIQTFLIKRLLTEQNYYTWYTDRDDILGAGNKNKIHTMDMLALFFKMLDVKIKENRFAYIIDKHTPYNSDFMSVPDLACGAISNFLEGKDKDLGNVKPWTETIINWLQDTNTTLQKVAFLCYEKDGKKYIDKLGKRVSL